MKRFVFPLLLVLISTTAFAQPDTDSTTWKIYPPKKVNELMVADTTPKIHNLTAKPLPAGTGTVKVHVESSYIDTLRGKYNAEAKRDGYRIQIYRGQESNAARTEKRNYMYKFDDQKAYVDYSPPYFIVTVGNFRTHLEAEHYLQKLREKYPRAYIIPAKIEAVPLPDAPVTSGPDDEGSNN